MEVLEGNYQIISPWISRSLYLIGKNASSSRVCKNQAVLSDFIMSQRTGLRQIMSGSVAEGTYTKASDVDRMQILPDIRVITRPDSTAEGLRNVFELNRSGSNPGYTRLQVPHGASYDHITFGNCSDIIDVTPDGSFLSSEKFVKYQLDYSERQGMEAQSLLRHGPCISSDQDNIYGFHNKTPGQTLESDTAFSLLCDAWPPDAIEWFTRERQHDWPSVEVMDKIRKEDCHVVSVGDPTSKHTSLEWRLSFLLGERELIWNFNDVQIQCYIILKLLKKTHIEPKVPDQVSSYHLKTVVFWQSENTGLSHWKEDRLLHCVSMCLSYLSDCVRCGRLEHYFYRDNNLLRHKLQSQKDRVVVMDSIESIQNNLISDVLACLPDCYVQKFWRSFQKDIGMLASICSQEPVLNKYYDICRQVNDTHKKYQGVYNLFCSLTDYLDQVKFLQKVSSTFKEKCPVTVDSFYIQGIQCSFEIRAGIQLYISSRNRSLSVEERNDLTNQALATMEAGSGIDDLVGGLYLATLQLCLGNYELCESIVLNSIKRRQYLLYAGRCSSLLGLEVGLPGVEIIQTQEAPVTGEEDEIIDTTFDVVFSKDDGEFVPYPVKFECGIFQELEVADRYFIIHPFTYAFSLLYMTQFFTGNKKKAREYLAHLAKTVKQAGESPFMYRALNILGFCYSLDGQFDEALLCYIRSVQITSNMPVGNRNAALYHLAILCLGVYTSRQAS